MSSLSELLKSMGVKLGSETISPPQPRKKLALEDILGGKGVQNPHGETFVIEQRYPIGYRYGDYPLDLDVSLKGLALWAETPELSEVPPSSIVFLDTETTGLSGGTGTYTFLIGVGKFEADHFRLEQFFLRDPLEEAAQLYALEEFLGDCRVLVTFNGKSFDVPLLNTRYLTHGWSPPLNGLRHLDLLHLARRLWRLRLTTRTLSNLETQILGAERTDADLPGWMIPSLYIAYLRFGEIEPLKRVVYHNAMDVLSLVVLMRRLGLLLAHPVQEGERYSVDLYSLARLFEDLQDLHTAAELYLKALTHSDVRSARVPQSLIVEALHRLALIYKRQQDTARAVNLWEEAARLDHLQAHIELAMFYEHQMKDYLTALSWAERAIQILERSAPQTAFGHVSGANPMLERLLHRKTRLEAKLERRKAQA